MSSELTSVGIGPWLRQWPCSALAGLCLGAVEFGLVTYSERRLFASEGQLLHYGLLSLPVLVGATGLFGAAGQALLMLARCDGALVDVKLRRLVLSMAWPGLSLALWALTAGRRVRELPGRALAVIAVGGVLAWLLSRLAAAVLASTRRGQGARWSAALSLVGLAALLLDMYTLRRLYPVYHLGLALVAVACALLAVRVAWPERARSGPVAKLGAWLLAGIVPAAAAMGVWGLASAPGLRLSAELGAPLGGKLSWALTAALPAAAAPSRPPASAAPRAAPNAVARRGIDLRGRDILLITVDALRADRLGAYGGAGLTPQMDRLARESVVFARAYTPTPNTSYAIAGLMTGKFLEPLMALPGIGERHSTLAQQLGRHGYRTAAFFPPAVFNVDGENFGWLRRTRFGFAQAVIDYANAEGRVEQLRDYLEGLDGGKPVFAWVHLLEPHEPYEPPAGFARGDSARDRYDGEVAAVDGAVGRLVETFRSSRPGATVIVTADHGEEFEEHGGLYHGTTLFEEQVRVPLLWSSPGVALARMVEVPVELPDIATTLLASLGIAREATMRGDDLCALLAGADAPAGLLAYATVGAWTMAHDGRHKAICRTSAERCVLFDLRRDPDERHDLSAREPQRLAELQAGLRDFFASLPAVEAEARAAAQGLPAALARAQLGDPEVGPELVPLLGDARAQVRARAARAAGELGLAATAPLLERLREHDLDAAVRAEAAVASLRLGEGKAVSQVRGLLSAGEAPMGETIGLRAAQALAGQGIADGLSLLRDAAKHAGLEPRDRTEAVMALARVGGGRQLELLGELLGEPQMRPTAARALGQMPGQGAADLLVETLARESDAAARQAEAEALVARNDPRAAMLIKRHLSAGSSIPNAVGLLIQAGALGPNASDGGQIARSRALRGGHWRCQPRGCRPLAGATLRLPAATGAGQGRARRLLLRVHAEGGRRRMRLADRELAFAEGPAEHGLSLPSDVRAELAVAADEGLLIEAVVVVEQQLETD
ncbi:MAG: sulfatase-like hydrolase/transferase [Myxococcales bacterium]|nr:sulfatase-like hydrolase/transferase [Myxococcales bacterium]